MIGWYVHHAGLGHLHRARAVGRQLADEVTGLSSLSRPDGWDGPWIELPRDDATANDPTAGGQMHWAPLHDDGLRTRMAAIAAWIEQARPAALVSDVSAEVALLARLHGIPVVSVVLPGDRSDPAHVLGYRVSQTLVAAHPVDARDAVRGLPEDVGSRVRFVGAVSRHALASPRDRLPGRPRVTVLLGAGGSDLEPEQLAAARRETPEWVWTVLGPHPVGSWVDEPVDVLRQADVVVTHAGQNALAEVAAARRPAVVIPQSRPHGEQSATARSLSADRWPATVLPRWPERGWLALLQRARRQDGAAWGAWCDGGAERRFADLVRDTAARVTTEALPS